MKILALFFLSRSLTFAQERFCIPWFSCVPYQFSFPYQFSSINTAQERFYTLELDWLSDLLPKHGITVGYIRYGVAPPGEAISEFQVMDMALHEKMQKLARPKERKLFLAKAFPNRAALVEFAQNTCARHGYSLTLENEVAHMFPNQEVAVTRLTQPITDFAFENQALGRIHYEIGRKIGIAFLGSDFPRP
ncbi:MAG: hypothetical protein NTV80_03210, partial [Verrucomicrobia bacterium]|nr:hypothetical protein [Verrucomicrobiota bacterium]